MNLIRYWRRIDSTLLMAVLGLGVICHLYERLPECHSCEYGWTTGAV